MRSIGSLARALLFAAAFSVTGCASLLRNPVPPELAASASIPNMPAVRAWAGREDVAMTQDIIASFAQESPEDFPVEPDGAVRYAHLALSGGGANGAFGAGFLNGWTTAGTRPVFKIVTGVSTGALMAPYAFLGKSHDEALRKFYTTTSSRDIFIVGSLLSTASRLVTGESLADTGPLAELIERNVDADLMAQVAVAHDRGRRLYIGTVDLDSLHFVVWNMGLIAKKGTPEALALFRQVMLASSSIPIVFPPVFFEVEAGGQRYDEMHVDGAVGARVFYGAGLLPQSVIRNRGGKGGKGYEQIFVIHNGQLFPEPRPTRRSVMGIGMRVLDATDRAAVFGDLFRIHAIARLNEATFHWVTIPDGIQMSGEEVFDPVGMTALFELGYRTAATGNKWATLPPLLQPMTEP